MTVMTNRERHPRNVTRMDLVPNLEKIPIQILTANMRSVILESEKMF